MAWWVKKALAPKPEGQLDPMPQIHRVEGKTDSHKLSSDFRSAMSGIMLKHTQK